MPSAYFDMAAAQGLLKELYTVEKVENLVYEDRPFLALVKKFTEFGGEWLPVPIITGTGQGRSHTFANAQGNQTALSAQKFLLTSVSDYAIGTIDQKTMLASATDRMRFLDGAQASIDGKIRVASNNLSMELWRTGTGSRAQVSTTVAPTAGGVITLQNKDDIVQIEQDMVLTWSATDGGTPLSTLGYVVAVDRTVIPATFTVSATALGGTPGLPVGWTTSGYVAIQGDLNAGISGVPAWITNTAPSSSDNFYTVNRSKEPTRLAGIRYDASAYSPAEGLINASMLGGREGAKLDYMFCNFAYYAAIDLQLGAKVQYVDLKGPGEIGFRGIRVNGARGEIKVVPDKDVPALKGFMLKLDTWRLDSLNEAPHISRMGDGLEMLRVYNQDGSEFRIATYANLECRAPGWNENLTLPM